MPKYKNRITNNTIIPTNIGINSTGATYNLPEVVVTPQNNSRITKLSAKDLKDKELLIGNINKGQNEFADRFAKGARNIADWLPITGDVLAGTDIYNAARQGNYGSAAALTGLMLLPNVIEKPIKKAAGYVVKNFPGYQLRQFMSGSKFEKQLSKTGTINVNNIKAQLKQGNAAEQEIVDKVLNDKFAGQTNIDYNDLKKAVQDEIITYTRKNQNKFSVYGIDRLGFKTIKEHDGTGGILEYSPDINTSTFTFESPRIPIGNGKHYDPTTIGHSRTYTTRDEPNVLHVMESQSDWGQHKINNPYSGTSSYLNDIDSYKEFIDRHKRLLEEMKANPSDYMDDAVARQEANIRNHEAKLKIMINGVDEQTQHLHDNFVNRQLQENLKYAAEKGQTRMRYPTRETAAKIEGYTKVSGQSPEYIALQKEYENILGDSTGDFSKMISNAKRKKEIRRRMDELISTGLDIDYMPKQQTILRKYDAFPKDFRKLYKDADIRTITDSKGNSWYEVDVPKDYLNQEWKFNMGGNSNLITRNGKPNVIRGGIARQFAPGLYYMNGRTHAAGGIDIGKNPKTGVEVEDGEVVQLNKNGMRVFSAMPFLTGESPASLVASGADPDVVFAAQENFKDRFGINDDGTMKAEYGLKVSTRGDEDNKYMTFKRMINTLGKLYYDAKVKAAKKNDVDEETISYYPSLETVQYIKGKEAFRPNIYHDGKGVPTIGYGTTQSTKAGKNAFRLYGKTGMTEEQASSVFNETVREMLPGFISATPNFNRLNDNQRNALFSYYYNVGHGGYTRKSPKLQQALKDFNLDEVVNQMDFGYYDTKNSGLRKRRDEERALFNMKSMGGLSRDKDYGSKKKPYPSVKSSDFAGGNRSYPIPTKADAVDALRLAGLHGRNDVKAKIYKKYPELKKPAGGVISINGNVKNGLLYTDRAKARFGDVYPIIRTKNGYITSGGYVPVDNKIDIYNGQQIEEPQYKIEGQGPVRSLVRGIPIKLDDGRGFYTITDRPAERVLGVRGFDNLMRVPNFIELENAKTAINDWNNQDVPDFENYTPRNNRTVAVSRNAQPVVDTPVWDDIFNKTVIGERPAVSPRTGRLSDNYSLTIPDRIIRGGEITPPDYRADITNGYIDGNFDGEVSQDRQPETDTTGGGFNLKDPAIVGAGINMLGTLGSYLINRNILNKARPRPTNVRLTAQKLKTRYNINPQLDELREQAAANNRLINNNTASSRTALGRMNLINTALGRSRAELYGNKENRETELINQDILNSQGVRNREAIYNAQLRAYYQDRLDDLNRLRLANNNALFSGLTGGVNSIIDSLLRQRYYNNTIGAIGARNPNVDARIFKDAGVDWSFMYPYSTRNRS